MTSREQWEARPNGYAWGIYVDGNWLLADLDKAAARELAREHNAALSRLTEGGAELARLLTAFRELYEWYDRDGSVGGASNVFEDNRHVLSPIGGSPDAARRVAPEETGNV